MEGGRKGGQEGRSGRGKIEGDYITQGRSGGGKIEGDYITPAISATCIIVHI